MAITLLYHLSYIPAETVSVGVQYIPETVSTGAHRAAAVPGVAGAGHGGGGGGCPGDAGHHAGSGRSSLIGECSS